MARFRSQYTEYRFSLPEFEEELTVVGEDGKATKAVRIHPPLRLKFVDGLLEVHQETLEKRIRSHPDFGKVFWSEEDLLSAIPQEYKEEHGLAATQAEQPSKAKAPKASKREALDAKELHTLVEKILERGVSRDKILDEEGRVSPEKVLSLAKRLKLT